MALDAGWCLLYTNLIDVPVEEGESSVTVANATAGVTANATAGATNSSMSEVGAIPFTSIALPKWVKTIGEVHPNTPTPASMAQTWAREGHLALPE